MKLLLVIPEAIRLNMDMYFLELLVNHLSEEHDVDLVMDYDISRPEEIEFLKVFKNKTSANKLYALSVRREALDFKLREEYTHKFKKAIEDLVFPESHYHAWMSLAYDEYFGSMENIRFNVEKLFETSNPDLVLLPIISVVSSTGRSEVLTSPIVYQAKKRGIKTVGYKSAGIIDRNFSHLYATYDYFLVHNEAEKEFLTSIGIEGKKIFVLREEYTWFTSATSNPAAKAYWEGVKEFRKTYGVPEDALIIGTHHIFSHRRDSREMAKALLDLPLNIYILVSASKSDYRRDINSYETAVKYTFYDIEKDKREKIIIDEFRFDHIMMYSDALVFPADVGAGLYHVFEKPIIVYSLSLPDSYSYRNILYTSKKDVVKSHILNYFKHRWSLKNALMAIKRGRKHEKT